MNILKVTSSANRATSVSTEFAGKVIDLIKEKYPESNVVERDSTYSGLPFVDGAILESLFVKGERTEDQKKALEISDELVKEVQAADIIVVASPMYNFSIPASLKAYFDMVARAGLTFNYTESGPVGLLENKRVVAVIASGGVPVGSPYDHASGLIKQFFGFLGISQIDVIAVDQLNTDPEASRKKGEEQVAALSF